MFDEEKRKKYSGSQISEVRSRLLKTLQDEALGVPHSSENRYSTQFNSILCVQVGTQLRCAVGDH